MKRKVVSGRCVRGFVFLMVIFTFLWSTAIVHAEEKQTTEVTKKKPLYQKLPQ